MISLPLCFNSSVSTCICVRCRKFLRVATPPQVSCNYMSADKQGTVFYKSRKFYDGKYAGQLQLHVLTQYSFCYDENVQLVQPFPNC
jgi:hypothetical protein